jgi:hypothetical protein
MYPLRPPSIEATRNAIDNMIITRTQDQIFQNAFRYLFIIAGRLSEVYGKYSPKGQDVFNTKIHGYEAILFPVKTAFRKGNLRAIALPINREPWSKILFEFFIKHDSKNPFDIGENIETSRRYLQWKALEVFKGHEWKTESYKRRIDEDIEKHQIIRTRTRNNKKEYLIEHDDGKRDWYDKPIIKKTIEVLGEWDNFTCQSLRSQRIRDLNTLGFSDVQLRTFTGLKQVEKSSSIIEWPSNEPISKIVLKPLESLAEVYFNKLISKDI